MKNDVQRQGTKKAKHEAKQRLRAIGTSFAALLIAVGVKHHAQHEQLDKSARSQTMTKTYNRTTPSKQAPPRHWWGRELQRQDPCQLGPGKLK
eukprot:CAMPEP_0194748890 /NCGR_PEP_ID=MMETSP0323_2-20130528/3072_1 /TAXON_ID=2866 ORGANISM="Crypthecodinium cohnii, Strain Seligo" /NCGR_SAMPLE_ID=MMETSP0323_2 /ASSEMBLY_ACC=CAM_ASM_000346 /LENGTH=92 /DNA_ID=CAMNT_0039663539 /DNA_START=9 /DNA_END=284 /DNA_ORIENTATION=+